MLIQAPITSSAVTMTISAAVTGPPSSLFGTDCTNWQQMLVMQVLSNAILFDVHSKEATPDQDSFIAYVGDWITVKPAINLRMRRFTTDSCVRFALVDG